MRTKFSAAPLVVCLLFTIALSSHTLSAQCAFTCPTADETNVQSLLDSVAASGGGTLTLGGRVYNICNPLIVGSNTHLRGTRGATIIRGSQTNAGKIVSGTHVGASIGTVGTRNVTISDLTVDQLTCQRNSNGISAMPAQTPAFIVPTNIRIEGVEVYGSGNPTLHNYMIWNFLGRNVKILNSWVDGGVSVLSPQEGIESFGGHDVLISGNTVRNIGGACINTGAADYANAETNGLTIIANNVATCNVGINHGTSNGSYGPQNSTGVRIVNNMVVGARQSGIEVATTVGTTVHDMMIFDNAVRDMLGEGSGVVGIRLQIVGGSSIDPLSISNHTVDGNHIANIRGPNAHGIRLSSYPNVRMLDNTITGVDSGALFTTDADDLEFTGNRVEDGGAAPVQLNTYTNGFARFIVDGNQIDWAGASSAILVLGGKRGTIRNNVMQRPTQSTHGAVSMGAGACGVSVFGNVAFYNPAWGGTAGSPACP